MADSGSLFTDPDGPDASKCFKALDTGADVVLTDRSPPSLELAPPRPQVASEAEEPDPLARVVEKVARAAREVFAIFARCDRDRIGFDGFTES